MKKASLRRRLSISFLGIILLLGVFVAVMGCYVIRKDAADRVRQQVNFLAILGGSVLLAGVLSVFISGIVSRPLMRLELAARSLSGGDTSHPLKDTTSVAELESLATAFNDMARKIEELTELNKNYLDLVGIVSHEFKGILASTVLNAYSVRDRHFGDINARQEKALTSITRNLDHLTITANRFLNLNLIERGGLIVHSTDLRLREDILARAVDAFQGQAQEKNIRIDCLVGADIVVRGDADMLRIVAHNLIRNAISYGSADGRIAIESKDAGDRVEIEVYNDGTPIPEVTLGTLFQKFSRLDTEEGRKVHGTGLGLFVTREIVEKHGGVIRCEPREHGNSFIFTIRKDGRP